MRMPEEIKIPEGYEAIDAGEVIPDGAMWYGEHLGWCLATVATIGQVYDPSTPKVGKYAHAIHVKPTKPPEAPTPDPKTKYLRDIYPVDGTAHTDANGKQFVRIDVYSVLRAFGVDHPTGHAVKKLLCAGMRGKGDRVQDLTEAKVAIDRAIQEAGI